MNSVNRERVKPKKPKASKPKKEKPNEQQISEHMLLTNTHGRRIRITPNKWSDWRDEERDKFDPDKWRARHREALETIGEPTTKPKKSYTPDNTDFMKKLFIWLLLKNLKQ